MIRSALRIGRRCCSNKGLDWSDEVAAAHIQTVILPQLNQKKLPADEAVEFLKTELANLKNLGCFVWNKSWATAMKHFTKPQKGRSAREASQNAAQRMFDSCILSGVDPTSEIYCKAIEAQIGYKECRVLFDFMVLDGTKPDEDTIAAILRVCCKCNVTGRHKAESLMSFLEHEGIVCTVFIWNIVLKIHADKGDLAGCADVFLRIQKSNLLPDSKSYEYLLQACADSTSVRENLEISENAAYQAHTDETSMTPMSYGHLMKVYRKTNNPRRAHALYGNVKDKSLTTKLLIEYSKVLKGIFSDKSAKKLSKQLMRQARRRYTSSIKSKHPKVFAALQKARTTKKTHKKKTKKSDVDVIGDAIKRHLQRQKESKVCVLSLLCLNTSKVIINKTPTG